MRKLNSVQQYRWALKLYPCISDFALISISFKSRTFTTTFCLIHERSWDIQLLKNLATWKSFQCWLWKQFGNYTQSISTLFAFAYFILPLYIYILFLFLILGGKMGFSCMANVYSLPTCEVYWFYYYTYKHTTIHTKTAQAAISI